MGFNGCCLKKNAVVLLYHVWSLEGTYFSDTSSSIRPAPKLMSEASNLKDSRAPFEEKRQHFLDSPYPNFSSPILQQQVPSKSGWWALENSRMVQPIVCFLREKGFLAYSCIFHNHSGWMMIYYKGVLTWSMIGTLWTSNYSGIIPNSFFQLFVSKQHRISIAYFHRWPISKVTGSLRKNRRIEYVNIFGKTKNTKHQKTSNINTSSLALVDWLLSHVPRSSYMGHFPGSVKVINPYWLSG